MWVWCSVRGCCIITGVTGRLARKVRFVVDYEASHLMINDERMLEDVEEMDGPVVIFTAKTGTTLRHTKKTVVVWLNKIKKLELYNVLFIPES